MRYLAVISAISGVLILGLLWWGRNREATETPALVALTVPATVVWGERVTVYGGVSLPPGRYELGTYSCQDGRCSRSLWLALDGPVERWGSLGSVSFEGLGGPAWVELRAYRADRPSGTVVAVWSRPVSVVEPAGSTE
jgi:hypothetical protein